MNSNNKQIRDVADVAARIMYGQTEKKEPEVLSEELKGGQHKIDANKNNKIDAHDFKMLRSKKKVEEATAKPDFLDLDKDGDKKEPMKKASGQMKKEEVKSIDEVKMADLPSRKIQGRAYGASKPEPHPLDVMKGPTEKQLLGVKSEKKKKFSEMVDAYKNGGLKSFLETLEKEEEIIDEVSKEIADYTMDVIDAGEYTEVTIGEEASQEEFNAEIEKAKAKSQGKIKAEVAKGSVQAVKQEETEITDEMIFEVLENAGIDFEALSDDELQEIANEAYNILDELSTQTMSSYVKKVGHEGEFTKKRVSGLNKALTKIKQNSMKSEDMDIDAINGVKMSTIEERMMTEPEKEKKEDIVKGMKKGMAGFKERYGDRAKNVMYATATTQAMKD